MSRDYSTKGIMGGFTLIEMIIVLTIIATSVAVVLPYITTSNTYFATEDLCEDLASTIALAVAQAGATNRPVRLVIDDTFNSFHLEIAADMEGSSFAPIEGVQGAIRNFDEQITVVATGGFDVLNASEFALIFDPHLPWPRAELSVVAQDARMTLRILGKTTQIVAVDQ